MGELKFHSFQNHHCPEEYAIRPGLPWQALITAILLLILLVPFSSLQASPAKVTHSKGVYHRIKKGETLMRISRAYGIPVKTIIDANRLKDAAHIEVDDVIFVPGAARVIEDTLPEGQSVPEKKVKKTGPREEKRAVRPSLKKEDATDRKLVKQGKDKEEQTKGLPDKQTKDQEKIRLPGDEKPESKGKKNKKERTKSLPRISREDGEKPTGDVRRDQEEGGTKKTGVTEKERPSGSARPKIEEEDARQPQAPGRRFVWPVKGRVVSRFGLQPDGMLQNGIRIATRYDRPVVASARGIVIYSAPLKDYGETIIIKHDGQYATVYTHLTERTVKMDDRVRQGSKIGLPGRIQGKAEGFMTFEIRHKNKAVNPLRYLK